MGSKDGGVGVENEYWEPALIGPDLKPMGKKVSVVGESGDIFNLDEVLVELEEALDSREMSLAMRKGVAKSMMMDVAEGKMGPGDKIRLFGLLNDRADGKVTDKVEVSGALTLSSIIAGLPNTTGLPKQEWIDGGVIKEYNDVPILA